ncbi:hypothetical protein [Methylomagnum sp.]
MIYPRLLKSLRWGVCCLALTACSHDYLLMRTEEQLHSYEAAIRWSLFKRAAEYLADPSKSAPDWKKLDRIKVTGYQAKFRDLFPSGKVLTQTVEIRYLTSSGVVEDSLVDEQRWRFDDLRDRWLLETGLPKFK